LKICPRTIDKIRPILTGSVGCLCLLMLLGAASPTLADTPDPEVRLSDPTHEVNGVSFTWDVRTLLAGEVLEALQAGLPATVIVEWRLWQKRGGWWDRVVDHGVGFYRIRYDVLSQRYSLFDASGRPLRTATDVAEIEAALGAHKPLKMIPDKKLRAGRKYFAGIRISVEALDDKEMLDLESWLRGDRSESSRSLLNNLKDKATGWLKNVVGPSGRSAWATSPGFSGAE
jgi:Domain of unknown function (DUF4390)